MKSLRTIVAYLVALLALSSGAEAIETKTIIAGVAGSETIVLGEGESAKLTYAKRVGGSPGERFSLTVKIAGKSLNIPASTDEAPEFSGPATIKIEGGDEGPGFTNVATFAVTRVGQFTAPACIPIEAGSQFNVILESSSDLVNWTPANPGSYPGTDAKRFFRTRIVKQ